MHRTGLTAPIARRACVAASALAFALTCVVSAQTGQAPGAAAAAASKGPTLDRIQKSGKLRLGYRLDARPFSFKDDKGQAAGYSIALCGAVAAAVKAELGMGALDVEWVALAADDRFAAVRDGRVDLSCGADTQTLARLGDVAFSLPIFPGGIGAVVRADAPSRLIDVLSGRPNNNPKWRASAGQLLQEQVFAVVDGTTARPWLDARLNSFTLTARVMPVVSYDAAIQALFDRTANVVFGDRAILLDAVARRAPDGQLLSVDRDFTNELISLTLPRGDDALRVVADRALSRLYASPGFGPLYATWFGAPTSGAATFFKWFTLPE